MIQLNFPNPVADETQFYGQTRIADIKRIESKLIAANPLSVVIIGERRIGKTSMQNVAIERLKKVESQHFVPLYVEPRGIMTLEDLAYAILQRLATHLKRDLQGTALIDANGHFRLEDVGQFEAAFASLLEQGSRDIFLLCIDEFDEIIRNAGSELSKIMGLINIFLERKTTLPALIFFTMTNLPKSIKTEEPSPLISRTELVELKPFSPVDMKTMVQGILVDQVIFAETELDWLYCLSGGHAYFTKLLLTNLVEHQSLQEGTLSVTREMLQQALESATVDPRAKVAIENLYRVHFDENEKRVVLLLADTQKSITVDALEHAGVIFLTAARILVQRNYLSEQQGEFNFRIAFLMHWLRGWSEFDEEIERLHIRRILDPWAGSRPTIVTGDDLWRYGFSSE
jgi:hypothetical protein